MSPIWWRTHAAVSPDCPAARNACRIAEMAGCVNDIGYTVPGQAWTYWNMGPGPGPSYTETDHNHEWSAKTGRTMAGNLVAVGVHASRMFAQSRSWGPRALAWVSGIVLTGRPASWAR